MAALIPLLLLFGLMWLLLIRPQKAQLQRHRAFLETLSPGDEVMTAGGVVGRLVSLDDTEGRLEIAPGVVVRVLKQRLVALPAAPVVAVAADIDDDGEELAASGSADADEDDDQ